jgi:DNA-binding transcriptional MocR family regulator
MRRRHNNTGRSTAESRHVRLYHWLMQTEAWRSLDATERAIYVEIASRYRGPESNNGRIPYSVREAAAALHIGKATASRALRSLEDRGFIVATQRGAFSFKVRHATEWRLTEFPCDVTDQLATKEFARWSPQNSESGPSSETVRYPEPNESVPLVKPSKSKTGPTVLVAEPSVPVSGTPRFAQRDTSSLPEGGTMEREQSAARRADQALHGAATSEPVERATEQALQAPSANPLKPPEDDGLAIPEFLLRGHPDCVFGGGRP